jgi:hypothetical protein
LVSFYFIYFRKNARFLEETCRTLSNFQKKHQDFF